MKAVMSHQDVRAAAPGDHCDVVVVGAGPYGLSTAAHLRACGLRVLVFGKPASLWREHMPEGMCLRSHWWASNVAEPSGQYALAKYLAQIGRAPVHPLPLETYIGYLLWFQLNVIPDVDETFVERIERGAEQFTVTLVDGRVIESGAVVLAPGLRYYVYRPVAYAAAPGDLVSHTGDHRTFDHFAGRRVAVLGGGQSAVETAALLHERGAETHLITRRPLVWLPEPPSDERPLIERLRRPQAGIGPGWLPWWLEHAPYAFQRLPRSTRDSLMRLAGPAAASWLKPRVLGRVHLHESETAQAVNAVADGLDVTLANAETLHVDHLVLGTGYQVDITRLPMLAPALTAQVRVYRGAPVLSSWFESSIPGLYFTGISAFSSCGPLFRFVVGTDAAARRVAEAVASRMARPRRVAATSASMAIGQR